MYANRYIFRVRDGPRKIHANENKKKKMKKTAPFEFINHFNFYTGVYIHYSFVRCANKKKKTKKENRKKINNNRV